MSSKSEIPYTEELLRKSIHFCSIAIPVSILILEREIVLYTCIFLMLSLVIPDILRKFSKRLNNLILYFFQKILREKERTNKAMLNGASWVMIDSVLIILIFPPLIASMALSILIVCDVFAAVIGRKFGKHKIFDKSIEGTVAFNLSGILLLTAYMTVYDLSWIFFIFGVIAVFAASMVELFAKEYNVDDNIAIPFTAGTILWVASSLLHSHGSGFAYIV